MKRKRLTDTYIRTRKPAKPGQRDETMDTEHPRVGLRVTDKGHRSFFYLARFPSSTNPTRRALGDYPTTTLAEAREKARKWDVLLKKSIDPRDEKRRERVEAEQAKLAAIDNVIDTRAKDYLDFTKDQRQHGESARIINKEIVPVWSGRPINCIAPSEVRTLIEGIAKRSPSMARNVLTVCKSFFDWAVDEASPAAALRPRKIIGKKKPRQRLLSDDELRAFWKGTGKLPYPYGPLYRLLALTGVRLREGAGARWREIDTGKRLWTIPPERFKSDCYHFVPLTDPVMQLLNELPRFDDKDKDADHLFSTTHSKKAINGHSKPKERLDQLMREGLGDAFAAWWIHDLRRLVRSKLSLLKVPEPVAEMVIGHGKRGLGRIYDQHEYRDELREALILWANHLRDLTEPPDPSRVVKLQGKRRRKVAA